MCFLIQRLNDTRAQIIFGIADNGSHQLLLPHGPVSGNRQDRRYHQDGSAHTRRQGDHGIPDEPEAKEHTDKQDRRRRQQQQCIAQIGPDLLVDLKGFGLPIVEVALQHAAAVRANRLLAVKRHLRAAGGAVDGYAVRVVIFLFLGAVGIADMPGLKDPEKGVFAIDLLDRPAVYR